MGLRRDVNSKWPGFAGVSSLEWGERFMVLACFCVIFACGECMSVRVDPGELDYNVSPCVWVLPMYAYVRMRTWMAAWLEVEGGSCGRRLVRGREGACRLVRELHRRLV